MALLTDDCDINSNSFRISLGGNGDYYISMYFNNNIGLIESRSVRISTSGGNSPSDVKIAISNLYRVLEKHKLNEHPDDISSDAFEYGL